MNKHTLAHIILIAAFGGVARVPADDEEEQQEQVRAALNEIKQNKLVTVLELPDDEEATFLTLYTHWEDVRWELKRRRDELMAELRMNVLRREGRELSAILSDIDEADAAARTKEAELRAEFRRILSDEQYAKLLIFEDSFNRNLRRLVQERGRPAGAAAESEPAFGK